MSTPTSPTLTCPKCHGAMRSYERHGVTVDQCTECRGIFLDRGELERLIDAEAAFYDDRPSAPQHQQPVQPVQPSHGQQHQAPSYSQPAYGATGQSAAAGASSGSDLGRLASEVFKQVSAARSSSSSSSSQYGGKRKKSFLDQLLG